MYWHYATPVTEQFGAGLTHQVFDVHAANRLDGHLVRAVCGRLITPAPMSAPSGRPCPACALRLKGPTSVQRERATTFPALRPGLRRLRSILRPPHDE